MAVLVKEGRLFYHLTSFENFESIMKNGLMSRKFLQNTGFVDVADHSILNKRAEYNLEEYVPFHFFMHNPFDGAVINNKPGIYVYIAIYRKRAKELGAKIIPKHPLTGEKPIIYDYEIGMSEIDWDLMEKRDFHNQECKLTCMAECLIKDKVSPNDFSAIFAPSSVYEKVDEIVKGDVVYESKGKIHKSLRNIGELCLIMSLETFSNLLHKLLSILLTAKVLWEKVLLISLKKFFLRIPLAI